MASGNRAWNLAIEAEVIRWVGRGKVVEGIFFNPLSPSPAPVATSIVISRRVLTLPCLGVTLQTFKEV